MVGTTSSPSGNDVKEEGHTRKPHYKVAHFEPRYDGDTEYARTWLTKYDWFSKNMGCKEEEKLKDIPLRLEGSAFTWFTNLPKPIQNSWESFSKEFLKQYAGGLTSSEAALQELKDLKKDENIPMHDFGTKLMSLLIRANVYALNLQLDYLRDKLPQDIAQALVFMDPTNIEEALKICTRMEAHIKRTKKGPVTESTIKGIPVINTEQQNYQSVMNHAIMLIKSSI